MRELTPEELDSTYDEPMTLLKDDDNSLEGIELFSAVEECIGNLDFNIDVDDMELHYAYQNPQKDFCHLGFNFGDENLYLVLVVQPVAKTVFGYAIIDTSKL
ncbi:MAG: hypothetical protein JXR91_10530 [Deltaproteobacteria bacterium]|nr:hypothetical protein [Deltaproteobacteria bacterium]